MSLLKLAVAAMPNNQFVHNDKSSDDERNDSGTRQARATFNKQPKGAKFKALAIIKETPKNSTENI